MERVAELLRQEIANLVLFEVKDPSVEGVNITGVSVSKDLSVANVRWMIYAPEEELERRRDEAAKGLDRAASFLRREVGQRVQMRVTPQLKFHWDSGLEHRRTIDDLLAEIRRDGGGEL
jgi:ribosome-binding factor A